MWEILPPCIIARKNYPVTFTCLATQAQNSPVSSPWPQINPASPWSISTGCMCQIFPASSALAVGWYKLHPPFSRSCFFFFFSNVLANNGDLFKVRNLVRNSIKWTKVTLQLNLCCFSSLPSIHFGHPKLCIATGLPRTPLVVLQRHPDLMRVTSIFFTPWRGQVCHCLQGLLDKGQPHQLQSLLFHWDVISLSTGKGIKGVGLKSLPNAKSHSSDRIQVRKIHTHS